MRFKTPLALLATAVLAVGMSSVTTASAAQQTAAGAKVYACVLKTTGLTRIVSVTTRCKPRVEYKTWWDKESVPAQTGLNTQGSQGATGARGPRGERGLTGPQGPAGPAGQKGANGAAGPAGAKGADGARGFRGEQGRTGPQGPAGPAGSKGNTGATGPKGDTGPAGQRGIPGPAGPKGDDGRNGRNGEDGKNGRDGKNGENGKDGKDGKDASTGTRMMKIGKDLYLCKPIPQIKNYPYPAEECKEVSSYGLSSPQGDTSAPAKAPTVAPPLTGTPTPPVS